MSKKYVIIALLINMVFSPISLAGTHSERVERKFLKYVASHQFRMFRADRRCHRQEDYRIYVIDNFQQMINIVPELATSHGEMLVKLVLSGRGDIEVKVLDTALSKGLAEVIEELIQGACADAVISSIPGSNYSYDQISSFFPGQDPINSENILNYRSRLRELLRNIAFHGFPSDEWLQQIDANPIKLTNDARIFVFIEALGQFNVPVLLPYGNLDSTHNGKPRCVNLLSLSSNAQVFTALDQNGNRIPGYPYSPLSSGDEQAFYNILEYCDPKDPSKAHLDINNDGYFDYSFVRTGRTACRNLKIQCRKRGEIRGTSVIPPNKVKELLPIKRATAAHE